MLQVTLVTEEGGTDASPHITDYREKADIEDGE